MYEQCMGKTIVFIGDSTVRDLANHMILRMENQSHKLTIPTPHILDPPFRFRRWNVTNLRCDETKGYGCVDCNCESHSKKCRHDWVDFEAYHADSATKVVFSWKPNLYSDSDAVAFYTRFLPLQNAIIFIGKGLHDAIFNRNDHVEWYVKRLYKVVRRFHSTNRVIMRTPFYSRSIKENALIQITRDLQLRIWDPRRVRIIDGFNMTHECIPYDNHHYNHDVHENLISSICK